MSRPVLLRLVALSAFLAMAWGVLSGPGLAAQKSEPVVGLSLPLTGQAGKLASLFLAGAKLALEDHNSRTGTAARLMTADDGCDREIARLAAAELKEAVPDIITGLLCNDPAYEIATQLRQTGIPVLVAGARSVRLITDREREEWNLWRLSPGDDEASTALAATLAKLWTGKAYAIVDDGTAGGRTDADGFRAGMEAAGLAPQFQDSFRPTQSTQARLVRRLQNAGVTHVFIAAGPEDIAMIARNAKELGVSLTIVGPETLDILPYLGAELQPPEGILAHLANLPSSHPEALAVLERIAGRGIAPEPHVVLGYQAMQVALAATGDSPAETAANLANLTFETVLGPVRFAPDGSMAVSPYRLYRWNGTNFDPAENF